ncbi:MAG: hypothetical protein IKL00_06490 [Oscillospiraceae bacterium]|nr:hypothetical protein [Oscillospiraceae bacterium]
MEKKQDPASGQEQNYDYIFEQLDKMQQEESQEKLTSRDVVISDSEGRAVKATPENLLRAVAPSLIIMVVMLMTGFFFDINETVSFLLIGCLLIGIAVWRTFFGKYKYHPHPIMLVFLTVGTLELIYVTAISARRLLPACNPLRSVGFAALGFGVIVTVYGVILLCRAQLYEKNCTTEITARCSKIHNEGFQCGKPCYFIFWEYEFGNTACKAMTCHDAVVSTEENTDATVYIDPAHPQRLRCGEKTILRKWASFYTVFGILPACLGAMAVLLP